MSTITPPTAIPALITTPLVIVAAVFPLLSLISILFRFRARMAARLPLQSDDYWIIISWVLSLSLSINAWTFGAITGIDHYKINSLKGVQDSLKCLVIASCLVQLPLSAVKISILLFYQRVFATPRFKLAVQITILFVFAWGTVFFMLVLFQGDPISASWTPGQGHLRWDVTAVALSQTATSVVLDVIILCFPLPIIIGLHMPTQRKVAVTLILWVGAFCCVAALVRLILIDQSIKQLVHSELAIDLQSKQFVFMMIEPNTSIIAACLPCYGPLFKHYRSPDFKIRKLKSVLPFRSWSSSTNSRNPKPTTGDPRIGSSMDSHIGLKQVSNEWSSLAHEEQSVVSNVDSQRGERIDDHRSDQINVTRAFDVHSIARDEDNLG